MRRRGRDEEERGRVLYCRPVAFLSFTFYQSSTDPPAHPTTHPRLPINALCGTPAWLSCSRRFGVVARPQPASLRTQPTASRATSTVRQLQHYLGPFLAFLSSLPPRARRAVCTTISAHACWMLMGPCNLMSCPTHGPRPRQPPLPQRLWIRLELLGQRRKQLVRQQHVRLQRGRRRLSVRLREERDGQALWQPHLQREWRPRQERQDVRQVEHDRQGTATLRHESGTIYHACSSSTPPELHTTQAPHHPARAMVSPCVYRVLVACLRISMTPPFPSVGPLGRHHHRLGQESHRLAVASTFCCRLGRELLDGQCTAQFLFTPGMPFV